MNLQLTWISVGVITGILAHAYHTVVWSSRITDRLSSLNDTMIRLDKELEKRDNQITAAWKKIDSLSERVILIEAKCHVSHKED